MPTLSVLMPVYNEARTLRSIVERVLSAPIDLDIELVAVDDGSSDASVEILQELAGSDPRIRVIVQPRNMGKGRAIRTAIEHMTGDIAIVQDADLEYDPDEFPRILKPILDGRADAVYGSRFATSEERRVLFFWHSLGNKVLTALSNMANDLNLTDMETCYKAVRGDIIKQLRLTSDRFGIEPEITARLAGWGARIYEVPISYHGRTYAEGKNIGWRDGVQALWLIFKFRFLDTRFSNNTGRATLEGLARAPRIGRWALEQFNGHLGDSVLEAGSGIGTITAHLLGARRLVAIDSDPLNVQDLARRFGHLANARFEKGDVESLATFSEPDTFDSVVAFNVLEHLDSPQEAMAGFWKALRPGGKVLVLVPAHPWLFSSADEALGHRKRYTDAVLRSELESAGLEVEWIREFNRLGVPGWWVNKQMAKTSITAWQARIFSLLLPLAKLLEKLDFLPGLSLIAVAQKPDR